MAPIVDHNVDVAKIANHPQQVIGVALIALEYSQPFVANSGEVIDIEATDFSVGERFESHL